MERVIGVLREKYQILNRGSIPIEYLQNDVNDNDCLPKLYKIVTTCCALVNLCDTVVKID